MAARQPTSPAAREAQAGIFASLRFSGFTIAVLLALLAAVIILLPSISTYIDQQREIAQVKQSVADYRSKLAAAEEERAKWKDPAYVRAQARERLFYVMPGETQLSIISDVVLPLEKTDTTSSKLTEMKSNWALSIAGSFLSTGAAEGKSD